ncbi:hypothetical protein [Nonomuraea sp. KM88]
MEGVIAVLIGGVFAAIILIVRKVFLFEELGRYLGDAPAQRSWPAAPAG